MVEVEDEEEVLVIPDDDEEEILDLEDEDEDEDEPEPVSAVTEAVVAEVDEEEDLVEEPTRAGHDGLLDTGEGFALRLPKDAVDNILASLENTPHDGYVPVVAFGPNGQIMLTFASSTNGA